MRRFTAPAYNLTRSLGELTARQSLALAVVIALGAGVVTAIALRRESAAIALLGLLVSLVFAAVLQALRRLNESMIDLRRLRALEGRRQIAVRRQLATLRDDIQALDPKPFRKEDICMPGVDIAASPRFVRSELYPGDLRGERSQDEADGRMRDFWASYPEQVGQLGINSGVTVIGRGVQNEETHVGLIDLASELSASSDQSVIWKFIQSGACSFRAIPPAYNFNQRALSHLSTMKQVEWLGQAILLHYPGSYPWKVDHTMRKLSHAVWHQAHKDASRWRAALEQDMAATA